MRGRQAGVPERQSRASERRVAGGPTAASLLLAQDTEGHYTIVQKQLLAKYGREFTWELKAKMMGKRVGARPRKSARPAPGVDRWVLPAGRCRSPASPRWRPRCCAPLLRPPHSRPSRRAPAGGRDPCISHSTPAALPTPSAPQAIEAARTLVDELQLHDQLTPEQFLVGGGHRCRAAPAGPADGVPGGGGCHGCGGRACSGWTAGRPWLERPSLTHSLTVPFLGCADGARGGAGRALPHRAAAARRRCAGA